MIIDTHTHFYDTRRLEGVAWPPERIPELFRPMLPKDLLQEGQPCGVSRIVAVEASPRFEDNLWTLDLCAREPSVIGYVGHLDPLQEDFAECLEALAGHGHFKGIRLGERHLGNGRRAPVERLEALAGRGLTLDFNSRSDDCGPLLEIAEALPGLRIVVNHCGHAPADGKPPPRAWLKKMELCASFRNVFCKVSGVAERCPIKPPPRDPAFLEPAFDELWRLFGEERLVFGSNWPVTRLHCSYADQMAPVKAYFERKGRRAFERVFWMNAESAYSLTGAETIEPSSSHSHD